MEYETLLGKHSAIFRDKCKTRSTGVNVEDLQSKGFAIMSLAVSCFDLEHDHKHVEALFTIMEFPQSFDARFYGNVVSFNEELGAVIDRFEAATGEINRNLIQQLLLMDVMLTCGVLAEAREGTRQVP